MTLAEEKEKEEESKKKWNSIVGRLAMTTMKEEKRRVRRRKDKEETKVIVQLERNPKNPEDLELAAGAAAGGMEKEERVNEWLSFIHLISIWEVLPCFCS